MTGSRMEWARSRDQLVSAIMDLGFPEELAKIGDDMAKEHYLALEKNAADCISCGHCNSRCPFSVDQMNRMKEIKDYFGE